MRLGAQGWAKFKILADYSQNLTRNLAPFIFFSKKKDQFRRFFLLVVLLFGAHLQNLLSWALP